MQDGLNPLLSEAVFSMSAEEGWAVAGPVVLILF